MSTAHESAKADHIDKVKTFKFDGVVYPIIRKPNTLLLSELARVSSGDPEAMGVIAEFFEVVLGTAGYAKFKKAFYTSELAEDDDTLPKLLGEIMEEAFGRPTK